MRKKEPIAETNSPLKEYKERQRAETLANIDDAIIQLHEQHLPLTLKTIANQSGLAVSTMYQNYIKEYVSNHPLMKCIQEEKEQEKEVLSKSLLEIELCKAQKRIEELTAEVKTLNRKLENAAETNRGLLRTNRLLMGKIQMKERPIKFEQL